jgi:hypothetical protein
LHVHLHIRSGYYFLKVINWKTRELNHLVWCLGAANYARDGEQPHHQRENPTSHIFTLPLESVAV